jgi:hypothetical protein
MQSEKKTPVKTEKPPSLWQRLLGFVCGGIAGIVLSVIFLLVLDTCGVTSGNEGLFNRFVVGGAIAGGILGFIFPRRIIELGLFLGNLIPGF